MSDRRSTEPRETVFRRLFGNSPSPTAATDDSSSEGRLPSNPSSVCAGEPEELSDSSLNSSLFPSARSSPVSEDNSYYYGSRQYRMSLLNQRPADAPPPYEAMTFPFNQPPHELVFLDSRGQRLVYRRVT